MKTAITDMSFLARRSITAKVRRAKDVWPDVYCAARNCLHRVTHLIGPDTPCPQHPVRQPMTSAQAGSAFGPEAS